MGNSHCLLETLDDIRHLKNNVHDSGDCVILEAMLDNSNNKYSPSFERRLHVILKLAPCSTDADNSLQIERDLYMFISDRLHASTPHVAKGLVQGSCNDSIIMDKKNSHSQLTKLVKDQWVALRMKNIMQDADEKTLKKIQRVQTHHKDDLETINHQLLCHELKHQFNSIDFIAIEKMPNETNLLSFIRGHSLPPESRFDFPIALQIAQALHVFHLFKLQHNRMTDLQNIMLEQGTFQFEYDIPKKLKMVSEFSTKIYNFQRATGDGFLNKTLDSKWCSKEGSCNKYRRNYDWYCFLQSFISEIEKVRGKSTLRTFFTVSDEICDPTHPGTCVIREKLLDSLMTPKDFIKAFPLLNLK